MSVDVSVIIVSFNVVDFLQNCLESLFKSSTKYDFEVLIVDNNSTDGSVEKIPLNFPQVHWVQNDRNVGFASANNQAIKRSSGRYIWLLNPDTILVEDALSPLVNLLEEEPLAAACGSLLLNPDYSLQPSCYPFPTLGREIWRLFHFDSILKIAEYPMQKWKLDSPREVDNIQGASLLLRKSSLDITGPLDDSFFMYTEEVDLNYRFKKAGWKILWEPRSKIIHFGGQSTKLNQTAMFLQLYKTKIQFFRKHYSGLTTWFYKLVLAVAAFSRIVVSPILLLQRDKSGVNKATTRNYLHLLTQLSHY
jgi:hypothetical protein